jgi:photosystem II stability/assembly factor-like uncharacterized protein
VRLRTFSESDNEGRRRSREKYPSSIPRLFTALALSALVWLGGLHRAEAGVDVWTPIGPYGGNISSLAIDPQNPATLYAAIRDGYSSVQTGVFKSTDGGATWSAANIGLPSPPAIEQLVIDPLTPTTLYAVSSAGGIYKSTDGGGTWSGLPNAGIYRMAIDPRTPTTLYASRSDGIYKSTDGGGSWAITGLAIRTRSVLAVDPLTPTTLYAASWGDPVTASGIFKSSDGGDSWSTLRTDPVSLLAIDPQTPTILYVVSSGGASKSTDGGGTWSGVGPSLTQSDYVMALAIDPQTPTTLYAGTWLSGIFKSTDGGASWSAVNTGQQGSGFGWPGSHPDVSPLAIDPRTPSTLYAGFFNRGIFKSTDAGGTWRGVGPALARARAVAVDPQTPTVLYLGMYYSGAFKSADGGMSWGAIAPSAISVSHLAIDPQTPTTLYAAAPPLTGLYRSADGGQSWGRVNRPSSSTPAYITHLTVDPQTPTTLYVSAFTTVGDRGSFKSTDGGVTWSRFPFDVSAIDPQIPTTLYSAGFGEFVKSTDGGSSWTTTRLDSPIICLAIDPQTPTTIYAGTTIYSGTTVTYRGGVLKSTDGGTTWSDVTTGLTNRDIRALAIDPRTPTTLYAGTYGGGVFKSTDGGGTWSDLNIGLTDLDVNILAVDPQTPATVYAVTRAGFLFTTQQTAFTLTVTVNDVGSSSRSGSVTSSPDGITRCATSCSASFDSLTRVTLTTEPDPKSVFAGWSGCDTVSDTTCTVTMNAARSVTATYDKKPRRSASFSSTGETPLE